MQDLRGLDACVCQVTGGSSACGSSVSDDIRTRHLFQRSDDAMYRVASPSHSLSGPVAVSACSSTPLIVRALFLAFVAVVFTCIRVHDTSMTPHACL